MDSPVQFTLNGNYEHCITIDKRSKYLWKTLYAVQIFSQLYLSYNENDRSTYCIHLLIGLPASDYYFAI